jgi:hypothetical protein
MYAKGYYGPICADFNCFDTGCANGGVCTAPDVCSCIAPWIGPKCEDVLCNPSCQNGICELVSGTPKCNCDGGW